VTFDDPVIIQEPGCPSSAVTESSEAYQAACFDAMFETLQRDSSVRYVTVFTLFDPDETFCSLLIEFFGITADDLPQGFFERWRGYLCTPGVIDPAYMPKPAWDVFLEYAAEAATAH
jgi:hypothetical protein